MKCEVCEKVIPNGDEIIVEAAKSVSGQDTTVCSVKCAKAATKTQPEANKRTRKGGKRAGDFVLMEVVHAATGSDMAYAPRYFGASKLSVWAQAVKAQTPGTFQAFRIHGAVRKLGEQKTFGFVE